MAGNTANFTGVLTNIGTATLSINGVSLNLAGSGLTFDDAAFFANAPVSIAPGGTTGDFGFFTVSSAPLTPVGTYTGAFSVLGGSDSSTTNELSGMPPPAFRMNVIHANMSNVPEPGDIAMFSGIAVVGTSFLWR